MEVNQLLDQKNPLGVPMWAEDLKLTINLSTAESKFSFGLQSKLGKVHLTLSIIDTNKKMFLSII